MLQPFSILVSADKAGMYDIVLPFLSTPRFVGDSPSRLYDDVALHLMERVSLAAQDDLPRYLHCPETSLRRVKVSVEFRDKKSWQGRVSVVLTRWPKEAFFTATLPRVGAKTFAVESPGHLQEALPRVLRKWGKKNSETLRGHLDAAAKHPHEFLDLLEVDLDLPTILPKTVRAKRRPTLDDDSVDRARQRRETPPTTLREVGVNLVHRALDGRVRRAIGREAAVDEVARRIVRPGAAIVLVGPSGVGKSALLQAVVAQLAQGESRLHARRDCWLVDANRIIAGMSVVGQWEGRCSAMVSELSARGDILVVDDLPSLVYAGRTRDEETNVAGFLEPHIAQGELRVLAECTAERLEAAREDAPGFFSLFQIIQLPQLDEATSLRVLVQRIRELEDAGIKAGDRARVRVDPEVPESVLALTRRFSAKRALPGRVVGLLDQFVAEAQSERRDEHGRLLLDRAALIDFFALQSGLPRFVLWEAGGRTPQQIADYFAHRIIGQPEGCEAVTRMVARLQQGLNDPGKPIASLFLVGPTGVGKTETAKALANYVFGSDSRMLRLDMSEFQTPDSTARLFGDVYRPDGELTRRIRQQPFSVILLDEIEKADPAVFDSLLQVLGEGRLTSADGRTTDFANTIVLMTSNLGVKAGESIVGFTQAELPDRRAHYIAAVRAHFRPEFFNRIDRVVPYRALDRHAIRRIVERIVSDLMSRRGLRRAGVLVDVEASLIEVLVTRGFDPRYGARALRRVAEQELAVPLARELVEAPTEGVTMVSLFRAGQGVGMEVWPLDEPAAPPATDPPAEPTRALLQTWHTEIGAWLAESTDAVEHVRRLSSEGLLRYNQGALEGEALRRFDAASAWALEHDELLYRLQRFEEEQHQPQFETRIELGGRPADEWTPGRVPTVVREEPYQVHALRPPRSAVQELDQLRLQTSELLRRADALAGAESRALLRILPATKSHLSLTLASQLRAAYHTLLSPRAEVHGFALLPQAGNPTCLTWQPATDDGSTARGFALSLRGFGLHEVLAAELGFHLELRFEGADLLSGLARVEQLGFADDAMKRLSELDSQITAFVEARERGERVDNPRGPLPLRRVFREGVAIDQASGARLRREALAEDLPAAYRRRLLGGRT